MTASIASGVVDVGASAVVLATADADGASIVIHNHGVSTVRVGASDVTTSTGFPVHASATLSMDVGPSVSVYGVSDVSVGVVVMVLNR